MSAFQPESHGRNDDTVAAVVFSEPATSTARTSLKPSSSTPTQTNNAMLLTLAPQRTFRYVASR